MSPGGPPRSGEGEIDEACAASASPFTIARESPAEKAGQVRVRVKGLEPIRREAPDPKSGLSTNSNTPA